MFQNPPENKEDREKRKEERKIYESRLLACSSVNEVLQLLEVPSSQITSHVAADALNRIYQLSQQYQDEFSDEEEHSIIQKVSGSNGILFFYLSVIVKYVSLISIFQYTTCSFLPILHYYRGNFSFC